MQQAELKSREVSYAVKEEIKYLRANIQFSGAEKKVILVTSAFSGEGKSTTTLMLARSLAELGKRVLLIDADLRRSLLRHELEDKNSIKRGLSHYLSAMCRLEDVLAVTGEPIMYMVFAGPVPPNPSEQLAGKQFERLVQWGRENFDYVLIDTPPLATVIDAAVVAQVCDGSVLLLEAGKVPYRVAQSVARQLQDAQCPVLGVILNKVEAKTGKRYYKRYYYKKYAYEYRHSDSEEKKAE